MLELSSARTVLPSILNFHWVIACSDITSKFKHLFCREILSERIAAMLSKRTPCNDESILKPSCPVW